jgi:hypothetical protein
MTKKDVRLKLVVPALCLLVVGSFAPDVTRAQGSARTPHETLEYKPSLRPQAITVATVNGANVDKEDFRGALVVCDVGPLGGTTPGLVVTVEDAADNGAGAPGTYAAVSGAAFTQFTATRDDGVFVGSLNLDRRRQWLRLVSVGTGTTPTGSYACGFVMMEPRLLPVTIPTARDFFVN